MICYYSRWTSVCATSASILLHTAFGSKTDCPSHRAPPVTLSETVRRGEFVFSAILERIHTQDRGSQARHFSTVYLACQTTPGSEAGHHTPSIAFRHLPLNSVRFSYATEGALFISAQLSTDAVSALRKVRVLIRLWKQPSAQART